MITPLDGDVEVDEVYMMIRIAIVMRIRKLKTVKDGQLRISLQLSAWFNVMVKLTYIKLMMLNLALYLTKSLTTSIPMNTSVIIK